MVMTLPATARQLHSNNDRPCKTSTTWADASVIARATPRTQVRRSWHVDYGALQGDEEVSVAGALHGASRRIENRAKGAIFVQ